MTKSSDSLESCASASATESSHGTLPMTPANGVVATDNATFALQPGSSAPPHAAIITASSGATCKNTALAECDFAGFMRRRQATKELACSPGIG